MKLASLLAVALLGLSSAAADADSVGANALGVNCVKAYPNGTADQIKACIRQGMAPSAAVAKQVPNQPVVKKVAKKMAGMGTKDANANERDTKGCPYLVETGLGLYHKGETRLCVEDKSMMCAFAGKDANDRFLYRWKVVAANTCTGFKQASDLERNAANVHKLSESMKKEGD